MSALNFSYYVSLETVPDPVPVFSSQGSRGRSPLVIFSE